MPGQQTKGKNHKKKNKNKTNQGNIPYHKKYSSLSVLDSDYLLIYEKTLEMIMKLFLWSSIFLEVL